MWVFLLLIAVAMTVVHMLRKQSDQNTLNEAMAPVGEVLATKRWTRKAPADSPYYAGNGLWLHKLTVRTPAGPRTVWLQTSARQGYRWCFDDDRDQEFRGAPAPKPQKTR